MSASTSRCRCGGERARRQPRRNSLHRQRQWALWGSYAALAVFVVMFLVPPFYTLMTSLKIVGGDLGAEPGSPWYRAPSDAGEFLVPDHLSELPDLLSEFGDRSRC